MPRMRGTFIIGGFVALLLAASATYAQPAFKFTKIVDLNGSPDANFDTIQAAIDAVPDDTTFKWTILVYAGTYTIDTVAKLIELDGVQENIDIVGVDREAVIIDVTIGDAMNPRSGIKITSGGESSRNNAIRNLTIKTAFGHGIEIVKGTGGGDQTPKDIEIEGVTILAAGTTKSGIEGTVADTVRIFDSKIDSALGDGIRVGHNFEIINSVVTALGSGGDGVSGEAKDGLRIRNCKLTGNSKGLSMQCTPEDLEVYGCEIRGGVQGVNLWNGGNIIFEACHIVGEGSTPSTQGVFVDGFSPLAGDITFVGCRIEAIGGGTGKTSGAQSNWNQNAVFQLRLVDCDISAVGTNTSGGTIVGVGEEGAIAVIGGSIVTSALAEKETEVWDLKNGQKGTIRVSGTAFSKWKGPIFAASRPRSVMQRTISVDDEETDGILTLYALTGSEQDDVTPTGQPDVYRVLSVTGNVGSMDQDVYIVGTDWADNEITEKIRLTGTTPAKGFKPFKTVTKIIVPALTSIGQSLTVGTTNKLGLYYPISAGGDVIQEALLVSGVYTTQDVGTVDEVYSTVIPSSTITDGDSFEWALLTGN